MIIIAASLLTGAADRDAPVAAFQPMVERARREGGCIDLHASADLLDAERINASGLIYRILWHGFPARIGGSTIQPFRPGAPMARQPPRHH